MRKWTLEIKHILLGILVFSALALWVLLKLQQTFDSAETIKTVKASDTTKVVEPDYSYDYLWEASDLVAHVDENEIASRHFVGQTITVHGTIRDFSMPEKNVPGSIYLATDSKYDYVLLWLKAEELEKAARLKKGTIIIAQGTFKRVFLSDVYLEYCTILEVEK